MKVLLYFESENILTNSGIGRALKHQQQACELANIEWTTNPDDDFDILHINTYGPTSNKIISMARSKGKKVIYHAHSTEEDFKNSFAFSNQIAPYFKKNLMKLYPLADYILTPTPYSKRILEGYGITVPIEAISNGIDINKFKYDEEKVKAFRKYFSLTPDDKVVLSVGLFFERKGILDFVEVARRLPQYKFIWFGAISLTLIPKKIKDIVTGDHPSNVIFPGYIKGAIIEGAYMSANTFFFPSYEETEGIVVLEALSAHQQVILRDIGAFEGWMVDKQNCYMGNNINEFVELVEAVVEKQLPSVAQNGYETAKQRSIENVSVQLKKVYEKVLKL